METISLPRTVKDQLVNRLRDDIIRGTFDPGEYLRLEEIASRFDVSTMPVREALRDLEAEGLVTIYPHRGAVVTELSIGDLQDIYDIRAMLEATAASAAVPLLTEKRLTDLALIVDEIDRHLGDVVSLVDLNHRFHSTLYAVSGRRHLCEIIHMLRYRTQHYLHAYIADLGGMSIAQEEHKAVLEACVQGDAERAASIIYSHVAEVGHALIEFVRQRRPADGKE